MPLKEFARKLSPYLHGHSRIGKRSVQHLHIGRDKQQDKATIKRMGYGYRATDYFS
ncbi:hypothetical protein OH492_20940 [Vibrio chagasii]|nr:hypothetical protein [Vibrio chagasii]